MPCLSTAAIRTMLGANVAAWAEWGDFGRP
jgi:hypothetical protein